MTPKSYREPVVTTGDIGKDYVYVTLEAKKEKGALQDGAKLNEILTKIAREHGFRVHHYSSSVNY